MELLHNGFTLECPAHCFPLSTDSMVLSEFSHLPRNARVLDLGSGCGILGLLLCAKDVNCQVTGIELDPAAHDAALDNIRRNHLDGRLSSICADLRQIDRQIAPGSFDVCIANPPYFAGGPASRSHRNARREDCCNLDDLFSAAAWALRYGGDFYLVHRPERLAEICACASKMQLEPKRLQLMRHRADGDIRLILVQCRKGGKPGLVLEEFSLFDAEGQPTAAYRKIYHL